MPYFTNDALVLALLMLCLAFVFASSSSTRPGWQRFYRFVPPLLLCYFLPALLNWPLGLISGESYNDGSQSQLYAIASRYLLPSALVLLCIGIDFKAMMRLGNKAIIMFLAASVGIVLGGPIALLTIGLLAPQLLGSDPGEVWRGLSTVAGSWIGGGANQAAMKEIYDVSDVVFSSMVIIDVVVANIWMACLLAGAAQTQRLDRWLKADTTAIDDLVKRAVAYQSQVERIPSTGDYIIVLAIAFVSTGLSHWGAEAITLWLAPFEEAFIKNGLSSLNSDFFWLIVIATTIGLLLSFTPLRKVEGVGASKIAGVFIYILVATIGMKMDLSRVGENLGLFVVGLLWMLIHVIILLSIAKLIRAPFFLVAVGSQANVGGAASAPVVASAFHPSLAPIGGIMAVWGYALGTYGAIISAALMKAVS